ncbi:pyruvate decarboxylase [Suhomyces tanzawaensis NRRL Y-17324]|uniref:Pyruvate decarboxylase n=1 Tax=Suhomyces tanzawaensis NRRL Y-17324 TaxID=984487 RepID=A0A1E4SMV2_9ASCO|nr:pyruvate decarboxylase [Suhomyces tanzawaensis NRRL Y-17324]ODV80747.1 pyruvate decarboxylase [Suhomyces tanzawaensis NRRL Y-17324]
MTVDIIPQLEIPKEIPLGEYLFLRIAQANPKLRSIFGVAGDYSLNLLEHLYAKTVQKQNINFVGLCNELNSAYVANGYSIAIGGLAVLITTFGVGELSAINGIASSFSEYIPILHIVGISSRAQRKYAADPKNPVKNFHHLIQNKNQLLAPNHNVYQEMSTDVSVVQEILESNDEKALDQIDRVLHEILQNSRPGYLFIPADLPDFYVSTVRLFEKLDFYGHQKKCTQQLDKLTNLLLDKLYNASSPSILSDLLISRFNLQDKLNQFIRRIDPGQKFLKLFSTNMGRNLDESLPNHIGCYFGAVSSSPEVVNMLEKETDTLFIFGHANMETNTASYSSDFSEIKDYIEINHDYILVDGKYHLIKQEHGNRLFTLENLLDNLIDNFDESRYAHSILPVNVTYKYFPKLAAITNNEKYIQQNKLLDFVNGYLQAGDILLIDVCAFVFGAADLKLPPGCQYISQSFYASIGHSLPTSVGVCFAVNDLGQNRRILVLEGDGSAQMTIQELSAFVRYGSQLKVKPQIFIMNNEGYTIERTIQGPQRSYNDIAPNWHWTGLVRAFGDPEEKFHTSLTLNNDYELDKYRIRTTDCANRLELVELKMDQNDVLTKLVRFLEKCKQ